MGMCISYLQIILVLYRQLLFKAGNMQFWKQKDKNPFSEIKRLAEDLSSYPPQTAVHKTIVIFNKLFLSHKQSLLSTVYEGAFKPNHPEWREIFALAIDLLDPKSEIGRTLLMHKDVKIDVSSLNHGNELESYLKQSEIMQSDVVKREDFSYKLPLLQCFFVKLALCIPFLREPEKKMQKWEDELYEDYFYFYIANNPILIILKNWLSFTKLSFPLYNRIIKVLEIILMRDVLNFMKQNIKAVFRLTIIHAVYLITETKVGARHWQFLEGVTQNLQKRPSSGTILTAWLRLNLSIILNATSIQDKTRSQLRNFNARTSSLHRQYFHKIEEIEADDFKFVEPKIFTNFLYRVESLIQKEYWECTPAFLQSICLIFYIAQRLLPQDTLHLHLNFLKKAFRRGEKKFQPLSAKISQFLKEKPFSNIIEDEQQQEDGSGLLEERQTGRIPSFDRQEREGRHRRSLFVHQGDLNMLSIWKKPLQSHQSYLLFEVSKSLAFLLDRILSKKQISPNKKGSSSLPITDVRFLASWRLVLPLLGLIFLIICLIR